MPLIVTLAYIQDNRLNRRYICVSADLQDRSGVKGIANAYQLAGDIVYSFVQ